MRSSASLQCWPWQQAWLWTLWMSLLKLFRTKPEKVGGDVHSHNNGTGLAACQSNSVKKQRLQGWKKKRFQNFLQMSKDHVLDILEYLDVYTGVVYNGHKCIHAPVYLKHIQTPTYLSTVHTWSSIHAVLRMHPSASTDLCRHEQICAWAKHIHRRTHPSVHPSIHPSTHQ